MFLLKSLPLRYLGNSANFHTAERRAAQNLSAWFAPREARTPSCRPGGNLRGHSPLVSLQPSNHKALRWLHIWLLSPLSLFLNGPPPPPPLRQGRVIGGVIHIVMNYGWQKHWHRQHQHRPKKQSLSCSDWPRGLPEESAAPEHVEILRWILLQTFSADKTN